MLQTLSTVCVFPVGSWGGGEGTGVEGEAEQKPMKVIKIYLAQKGSP